MHWGALQMRSGASTSVSLIRPPGCRCRGVLTACGNTAIFPACKNEGSGQAWRRLQGGCGTTTLLSCSLQETALANTLRVPLSLVLRFGSCLYTPVHLHTCILVTGLNELLGHLVPLLKHCKYFHVQNTHMDVGLYEVGSKFGRIWTIYTKLDPNADDDVSVYRGSCTRSSEQCCMKVV